MRIALSDIVRYRSRMEKIMNTGIQNSKMICQSFITKLLISPFIKTHSTIELYPNKLHDDTFGHP